MFAATVIAVPIFLMRVSEDHFVRPRAKHSLPVHFLRVVVGLALIVLGIAMVVLPGQGLLTILVGVSVLDPIGGGAFLNSFDPPLITALFWSDGGRMASGEA